MFDNTADIIKQISLGEDSVLELKTVEFSGDKITGPHRNSMADELAAMANTHTGVVLLGVDDKSKAVHGIPQYKLDIVETWLRSICNDLIEPPLDCVIRKTPIMADDNSEKVIIRVDVPRSLFVHQSPGGYFRRIDSSKRQMKPDVLARLFQQRTQTRLIRFDEQPIANADPDGLLLEEGILEGISERGFELIPFEDYVAFRYAYETKFRSRWDKGEQTDLVVALRSGASDLGSLPYDLLQAGRRLSFNLGEIFPNLSYPVIASLDRGDLEALRPYPQG